MDYCPLLEFHRENKADLTVAFTPVPQEEAHRFGQGVVELEKPFGGRLKDYREKVSPPVSNLASLTIYAFRPEVLEEVLLANAREESHEFGRDIIPKMLGAYKLYGFVHQGYWGYTRTIEEYWQTHMDLLGPKPKIDLKRWQVCTNLANRHIRDRQPTIIGLQAKICDSLFYNGSRIEGEVIRSVLYPGVKVEKGAVVKDSILLHDTVVQRGARLERVITDTEVVVSEGAQIGGKGPITTIGRRTILPPGLILAPGVVVHPELGPEKFSQPQYPSGVVVQ